MAGQRFFCSHQSRATSDGVSLCGLGWSAVVQSWLTVTSASWVQAILLPQPPKWLGLQCWEYKRKPPCLAHPNDFKNPVRDKRVCELDQAYSLQSVTSKLTKTSVLQPYSNVSALHPMAHRSATLHVRGKRGQVK
ncbi:putative uncharacterized protein SPANXA2-OT1 [Plecturocebus cupreus]